MIVYDEDAFFGSGEYEVRTVSEVLEYLTEEEQSVFNKMVDLAENRRRKAVIKSKMFSRGYEEARTKTNNYKGEYVQSKYRPYYPLDCVEEAFNECIQSDYLGG